MAIIRYLHLGLTAACNLNCKHCFIKEKESKELSFEKAIAFIDVLEKQGLTHIYYTYGEPLLYHRLFEFSKNIRLKGIYQVLMTNGTQINYEVAQKIAASGINRVMISIDSSIEKKHDMNRGKQGSFGLAVQAIQLLKEQKVNVGIASTITNDTGLEHTTISLEKLVDMSDGLTLTTMQEAIASKEATIRQVGISIIGVTLFLLLFSIITFASTIITNIATKKREYAMFQSIGMTRKQTEKMALCESCVLAIGSLILTLILGIILGQILIKGLISAGIFYLSYTFPLALFTVYCIVVVLIILMITISAFYSLQKTPLVERLRIVD